MATNHGTQPPDSNDLEAEGCTRLLAVVLLLALLGVAAYLVFA
jgi:hypothetical protein